MTSNAAAGTAIGDPVNATDADTGDRLTYSLAGTDAASFSIDSSTGQLLTVSGVTLEEGAYEVTVVATDNGAASAIITVTINVVIADEPGTVTLSPSRPIGR